MKRWNHSLVLPALGVSGRVGSLIALYLRGVEHLLLVLTLGAMIISGLGTFLAGRLTDAEDKLYAHGTTTCIILRPSSPS
jgi:acyl-coenzyme A thioesterase PaaI-like protein